MIVNTIPLLVPTYAIIYIKSQRWCQQFVSKRVRTFIIVSLLSCRTPRNIFATEMCNCDEYGY